MKQEMILQAVAVAAACAGAFQDYKTRKIKNQLTLSALICGLILNLAMNGISGGLESLKGIGVACLCMIIWIIGGLKAGDVKLYMAIGALAGWRFSLSVIVISILCGGILSFFMILVRKDGKEKIGNLWCYMKNLILTKRFFMYQPDDTSSYFCFGGCIALGAVITFIKGIV